MRLCGQQAVWNYEEENGLLTIQGVGAMEDYTEPEQVPWNSLMQEIKVVVIRDGITTVGDYAFAGCSNLQEVTLPGSVEIVGVFSFKGNCHSGRCQGAGIQGISVLQCIKKSLSAIYSYRRGYAGVRKMRISGGSFLSGK